MTAFSDRPFAAGSLIGLRAFTADSLGRMLGPVYGQIFRPGDNEAECRERTDEMGFYSAFLMPRMRMTNEGAIEMYTPERPEPKTDHTLAGLKCGCGFYAYFDGANDYVRSEKHERIGAVIEGFGVCTVGSRGFRASKARLVALITPAKKFPPLRLELIQRNYPGVPTYGSKREALDAHPLTPPPIPDPETCDDFWTRAVS